MSFDETVEARIKETLERGDFDNLPGKGKLIDLTDFFNTPEDVHVAQSLLRNAGMVPVEIELLEKIAELKDDLSSASDDIEKTKIQKHLKEKQLQFNLLLERSKR